MNLIGLWQKMINNLYLTLEHKKRDGTLADHIVMTFQINMYIVNIWYNFCRSQKIIDKIKNLFNKNRKFLKFVQYMDNLYLTEFMCNMFVHASGQFTKCYLGIGANVPCRKRKDGRCPINILLYKMGMGWKQLIEK